MSKIPKRTKKEKNTKKRRKTKKEQTRSKKQKGGEDDDNICGICIDKLLDNQDIVTTGCNHKFHRDCLTEFCLHKENEEEIEQSKKCPMCRENIIFPRS